MKQHEVDEDESTLLLGESSESRKKEPQQHWSFAQKHENTDLREIIEAESKTDFKAFGMLMVAWILVVICSLAKTSLTCGSTWFYGLAILPIPILFAMSWRTGIHAIDTHERKIQLFAKHKLLVPEAEFSWTGEAHWTRECVSSMGIVSFFAGAAAGSLGIAAALLIGPFLLQAGMNPMVAMASTGVTILIVSSATTLQFFFLGQLKKDYALLFMAASFLGGLVGNTLMNCLVKRLKTSWFLIAILAVFLILSTVSLGFLGVEALIVGFERSTWLDLRDFCVESWFIQ